MTAIATLGFGTPGSIANVVLLGFGATGYVPPPDEEEAVSGGWLSPEQARSVMRKIQRTRSERARRAEELQSAIQAAQQSTESPEKAVEPLRRIIERDTGAIMLPALYDLQDAINQLAQIDQQIAMLNMRRMDDAAAMLLLTEL